MDVSDRTRLTADQKKKNHIESEKKRRLAIRAGYAELCRIMPDAQGLERSESVVLQKTVTYLREQLDKKEMLRQRAAAQGLSQAQFEKIYNDIEKALYAAEAGNASTATAGADDDEEEDVKPTNLT